MTTVWDTVVKTLEPYAEQSLPDRCTIVRVVKSGRVDGGAYVETPTTMATAVPCRVTPAALAAQEALVAESPEVLNRWLVAFWRGRDLETGDTLTATGTDNDGRAWTRTLSVVSVDGPRSYEVLRTATCSELSTSGR